MRVSVWAATPTPGHCDLSRLDTVRESVGFELFCRRIPSGPLPHGATLPRNLPNSAADRQAIPWGGGLSSPRKGLQHSDQRPFP